MPLWSVHKAQSSGVASSTAGLRAGWGECARLRVDIALLRSGNQHLTGLRDTRLSGICQSGVHKILGPPGMCRSPLGGKGHRELWATIIVPTLKLIAAQETRDEVSESQTSGAPWLLEQFGQWYGGRVGVKKFSKAEKREGRAERTEAEGREGVLLGYRKQRKGAERTQVGTVKGTPESQPG